MKAFSIKNEYERSDLVVAKLIVHEPHNWAQVDALPLTWYILYELIWCDPSGYRATLRRGDMIEYGHGH